MRSSKLAVVCESQIRELIQQIWGKNPNSFCLPRFALHTASACWMHEVDCGTNTTEQCEMSRKFHYEVLNCEFGVSNPLTNNFRYSVVDSEQQTPGLCRGILNTKTTSRTWLTA